MSRHEAIARYARSRTITLALIGVLALGCRPRADAGTTAEAAAPPRPLTTALDSVAARRDDDLAERSAVPDAAVVIDPADAPPHVERDAGAPDVLARATEILLALKAHDLAALAERVHPDKGLRFSPYAYVDKKTDRTLRRADLARALTDATVRAWGAFDGSGDPIQLTFAAYFARFVWDKDFSSSPQISIDQPISAGNTTNNARDAYPQATIVELYLPGHPPHEMDWRALRLVFEKHKNQWLLIALIHSEWTT